MCEDYLVQWINVKGALVEVEGITGSGKSTQVELLAAALQSRGFKVTVFSYPDYASEYGQLIRKFLDGELDLDASAQFLLYLLDIVKDKAKILEKLDEGHVVILDRYFMATIAHQSAGGFDVENAKNIVRLLEIPCPDLVFYVEVPVPETYNRKFGEQKKFDRFEKNALFLQEVAKKYDTLCKEQFLTRWVKLDGTKKVTRVGATAIAEVLRIMKTRHQG